jgi:uncharacterized repeat protein (TIGR01451 family)
MLQEHYIISHVHVLCMRSGVSLLSHFIHSYLIWRCFLMKNSVIVFNQCKNIFSPSGQTEKSRAPLFSRSCKHAFLKVYVLLLLLLLPVTVNASVFDFSSGGTTPTVSGITLTATTDSGGLTTWSGVLYDNNNSGHYLQFDFSSAVDVTSFKLGFSGNCCGSIGTFKIEGFNGATTYTYSATPGYSSLYDSSGNNPPYTVNLSGADDWGTVTRIKVTHQGGTGSVAFNADNIYFTFPNAAPSFNDGASTTLSVQANSAANSINALLDVTDANTGDTLTWSITTNPSHGTLGGFNATATSNGGTVTPAGLTYTPTTNYSGADSFTIQVSDGMATDSITVNVTVAPYPLITGGDTQYNDYITNVTFAGINKNSGNDNGYADYTSNTGTVNTGAASPLSCTINLGDATYPAIVVVWFDWNQDHDFDDADERYTVGTGLNVLGANTAATSIAVPGSALGGTTRMRIVMDANDGVTIPPNSGSTVFYGDAEDYSITVISNPPPTTGTVTANNVTQANAGQTSYSFTVTYTDDSAVDVSTINTSDVTVTGCTVTGAIELSGMDGTPKTATYTITPPGGSWNDSDNGAYTIGMVGSQVGDNGTPQLFVAANASLATFTVSMDTTAPTVTINQAGGQSDPTNASPINFTVVFSESVGTSFVTGDVTLSGTAGATTGTVTEIAPNDGTTYNVAVSGMTGDGTVIASILAGKAQDLAGNNNTASTSTDNTVMYVPPTDLSITKTDGVTTAVPGGSVTYTITASNAGSNDDPSATVADTFPASLTATWTCVGAGGGTCTASGSGNINNTVNLPVGGSVTYTVSATISASAIGTLSNTATVSSSISDTNPGNNSATDTDTLTPQADLSITKTDGVTTAVPGGSVTYTITASNAGPSNASGATVADTFPASLTPTWTCVGAGGGTCTASGSGNINDTVNLPAGGSVTYTVSASVSAAATGSLSNTATVTAPAGVTDPTPGNNSATDTDTLSPQADLSITKTDGVTIAVPGGSVTYTITASNAGPSNAFGATVADTFPASLTPTWTCVGAGGGTCTASGSGNINDTVNLPPGGSVTFTASAMVSISATGTVSNTATVTAPGGVTDPTPGNNSATDSDSAVPPVDVTINQASGQADPTNASPINFTAVFASPVTDFDDASDVTLTGTAGATTINITGGPTTYNVAVSGMTGDGTVSATIAAGVATGSLGEPNAASSSGDNTVTYDATAPDTSILTNPANPTNNTSASFTFSGTDGSGVGGLTFECNLDGGGFSACSSPKNYSSLSDGSHTFQVRAVDSLGNTDATPASYTWVVDTIAPNTTMTGNPPNPSNSASATFTFTGNDGVGSGIAGFECDLDGGGFSACATGINYTGLLDGSHTFRVRAVDNVGLTDATPASFTWVVDTVAPTTNITGTPSNPTTSTSAAFTFTGADTGGSGVASFECDLDGGGFSACTTPKNYTTLADGSHTFQVRAIDNAGNPDATPASFTWVVDASAPDTTILSNPADPTNNPSANFTFSGNDGSGVGVASFECDLDGGGFSACPSPKSYNGLADGSHTFQVRAIDSLGNTDATPASFTWTVDTTAPTAVISSSAPNPTNTSPIPVTITFSEPVYGFGSLLAADDLAVTNGTASDLITGSDGSTVYTFTITPGGQGAVTVYLKTGSVRDLVSNYNTAVSNTLSRTYDTVSPTVTVNLLTTQDTTPPLSGTVNDNTATMRVTVTGTTYLATNNGNGTWTLADNTITPALAVGVYDVSVTATDPAGNVGTDTTTNELTIRSQVMLSGQWQDANKTLDGDDDDFCWAAAAADLLAWGGWGTATYNTAQTIFANFKGHWTDAAGIMQYGWRWWLNGTTTPTRGYSGSTVNVTGAGKYWATTLATNYLYLNSVTSGLLDTIAHAFTDGFGVTAGLVQLATSTVRHALTVWGYESDALLGYTGLYVTDASDGVTALRYVPISYDAGLTAWTLGGDYLGWYLREIQAFGKRGGLTATQVFGGSGTGTGLLYSNDTAGVVPEPATWLLIGLGLLGIARVLARQRARSKP